MSRDDLLAVRNFGEKSLTELADRLMQRKLLPAFPQSDPSSFSNHAELDGNPNL
jgi:DNA-directed RNA polymerase alpha subunit